MMLEFEGFSKITRKIVKENYKPFKVSESVLELVDEQYSLLKPTKDRSPNLRLWLKPKGKIKIIKYKNFLLDSDVDCEGVPEVIRGVNFKRANSIAGHRPKYLAVRGFIMHRKNKDWFIATDILQYNKKSYTYLDGVNRHLAHALLAGKGFKVLPYWLSSPLGFAGSKTKNFKDLCGILQDQAKIQRIKEYTLKVSDFHLRKTLMSKDFSK